ncbi:hypothetical protein S83_066309, partial [Arachis hypogaea]
LPQTLIPIRLCSSRHHPTAVAATSSHLLLRAASGLYWTSLRASRRPLFLAAVSSGTALLPAAKSIRRRCSAQPSLPESVDSTSWSNDVVSGSPDVFSSLAALRSGQYRIGFGTILSAGTFVSALIVGFIAIYAAPFSLDPVPFVRDVLFYLTAAMFLFYVYLGTEIFLWQAIGFVGFYAFFVGLVFYMDLGVVDGRDKSENSSTDLEEQKELVAVHVDSDAKVSGSMNDEKRISGFPGAYGLALDSFDSFLQCTCESPCKTESQHGVMKSSDKPPKGSNSGTLAAESPVVNNLLLPYLRFLKPMASSPHFDDQDFDFEGGFFGTCSGEKRPSPDYDDEYYDNDPFALKKAKSKAEEAASGVTTGMILSLRERLFEQRTRWRLGITDEDQCMLLLDFSMFASTEETFSPKEKRNSKNVWGLPSNVYNGRQRSCKLIRNTFLFSDPKQQLHLHAYHAFSSLFSHHEGRRRDLTREGRDHGERFRE